MSPRRSRLPRARLRGTLVALATTALLGATLEGWLTLRDVGGRNDYGLNLQARYLVPHSPPPGNWRTQFYSGDPRQRAEIVVPAKSSRTRVVLVGGSNARTFLFPDSETTDESFFETVVNTRTGGESFEIVNLGRAAYGSRRVRAVFEQALDALEPDVLVVTTGDNELMECTRWWSATLNHRRPYRLRLRTGRWIRTLVRGSLPDPVQRGDCPDLEYATTLNRLDLLTDNLHAMTELALERGTRILLATLPYNRFEAPSQSPLLTPKPARLHARARSLLPPALGPLLRPGGSVGTGSWIFGRDRGATERPAAELPGRRPAAGELLALDPELSDYLAPEVWKLHAALERLYGEISPTERDDLEAARALLAQALELAGDHALLHFELAIVCYALDGPTAETIEHFETAAILDHAPRKASELINDHIRQVAATSPRIELFDADLRFSTSAPDRLPGYEWFYDGCHLNVGARKALIPWLSDAISVDVAESP